MSRSFKHSPVHHNATTRAHEEQAWRVACFRRERVLVRSLLARADDDDLGLLRHDLRDFGGWGPGDGKGWRAGPYDYDYRTNYVYEPTGRSETRRLCTSRGWEERTYPVMRLVSYAIVWVTPQTHYRDIVRK